MSSKYPFVFLLLLSSAITLTLTTSGIIDLTSPNVIIGMSILMLMLSSSEEGQVKKGKKGRDLAAHLALAASTLLLVLAFAFPQVASQLEQALHLADYYLKSLEHTAHT